jgi:hypothetical protein
MVNVSEFERSASEFIDRSEINDEESTNLKMVLSLSLPLPDSGLARSE